MLEYLMPNYLSVVQEMQLTECPSDWSYVANNNLSSKEIVLFTA